MPWGSKTVENLRKEFIESAKVSTNFSSLCREFNITRRTGYKWLNKSKSNLPLTDGSHSPKVVSNKTPREVEDLILEVRERNPEWGGKTIRKILENANEENLPCVKTCNNILKRNGCITTEKSLNSKPYKRFERESCNELWQTDFKGDFSLLDGSRCFALTILDDHSRFSIKIAPKLNTLGVLNSFKEAFYEYGMPLSILSDNGGTFRGLHGGYTTWERWLMEHNILPIHGRVMHPQTQGKIERFHRTLKNELLKHNSFQNLEKANESIQRWRDKYNHTRPHQAIGMKCPGKIYVPSSREYKDTISKYEYGGQHHVIKVNSWGYLRFDKWQEYLSETMAGQYIEIRSNIDKNSFSANFRNFKIAEFDADTGKRLNRSIFRL